MKDKQQLKAMGEHMAEQAEQAGQSGQAQPLCMAKRIEELEAQVRALTLPEGWELVPVEPTREMMAAAMSAVTQPQDLLYSQSGWGMNEMAARTRYRAMLAAAPKPEAK